MLVRFLVVFHCLLALGMPARALNGAFMGMPESRTQSASAEHCHESGMQGATSGKEAEAPHQMPLSSHAACVDCLLCSSGCLPADLASGSLQMPSLLEALVPHQPVLAIGLAPAPELKPPRA